METRGWFRCFLPPSRRIRLGGAGQARSSGTTYRARNVTTQQFLWRTKNDGDSGSCLHRQSDWRPSTLSGIAPPHLPINASPRSLDWGAFRKLIYCSSIYFNILLFLFQFIILPNKFHNSFRITSNFDS